MNPADELRRHAVRLRSQALELEHLRRSRRLVVGAEAMHDSAVQLVRLAIELERAADARDALIDPDGLWSPVGRRA